MDLPSPWPTAETPYFALALDHAVVLVYGLPSFRSPVLWALALSTESFSYLDNMMAGERGGSYPLSFGSIENGLGTGLETSRNRSRNPDGSGTKLGRFRNDSETVPERFRNGPRTAWARNKGG